MRTRVIIWGLVGLVVVAGVVFIVATSGKTPSARLTDEAIRVQADRVNQDLAALEAQANGVRQHVPQGVDVAELFGRFDSLALSARASLDAAVNALAEAPDVKLADKRLTEGRKAASEARQTFKRIERTISPRH
jgi:membrane-bound lytic murein transglycosylase B